MCTLLVATRLWTGTPLLVFANRDENLGRPSAPPSTTTFDERRVFAPRDLRAGGTWMGVNDAGVLVAITNRFSPGGQPQPGDANKLSRGLLTDAALKHSDAAAAAAHAAAINPSDYNGFHLLCADRHGAWVTWSDSQQVRSEALLPGIHVVTERSYGAASSGREDALNSLARQLEQQPTAPLARFEEALGVHRDDLLDSTCVHFDAGEYGTRSSSMVHFDEAGPTAWYYADGPPCRNDYRDLSEEMIYGLRSGDQSVAR